MGPQPGSQEAFLQCPIFEVLYHGNRGPGKTDALIMDYAQLWVKVGGKSGAELFFDAPIPSLKTL